MPRTFTDQPRQSLAVRKLHRTLAPIMLGPMLLTLLTGSAFQFAELLGEENEFEWLIQVYKGNFGPLHLEVIYPFLNALGLLGLAITGILMWRQIHRRQPRRMS